MRISHILIFLFFAVPLLEIYLLIQVGSAVGALTTVFLVVFTAVLGGLLMRVQGMATFTSLQQTMQRGEIPALQMFEGAVLLLSGALLLTPGFFTDILGFMGLITPLRRYVILRTLRKFPPTQGSANSSDPGNHTLEAEYWREED